MLFEKCSAKKFLICTDKPTPSNEKEEYAATIGRGTSCGFGLILSWNKYAAMLPTQSYTTHKLSATRLKYKCSINLTGIEIGKFKLVAQTRFLIKKNVYMFN